MFNSFVKFICVLQVFVLVGCASIPIMSLPKLMSLDLETVDMSQVELAVRVQDTVGIQEKSAQIKIDLEQDNTGEKQTHVLILETPDENLTPFLRRQQKQGYKVHRFKMTQEQAAAADLFRQKALTLKARNKNKNTMTVSARVYFCQYRNLPSYDDISMTFYVRTKSQKDFFTLFKEQKIEMDQDSKNNRIENPKFCE